MAKHPEVRIPWTIFHSHDPHLADVFVDVGNKHCGIVGLSDYLGGIPQHRIAFFGDQFTVHGNDVPARDGAVALWIDGVEETVEFASFVCARLRQLGTHEGDSA